MRPLREPLLDARAGLHGFGVRDAPEPAGLLRPRQVHGIRVVSAAACRSQPAPEADAVVSLEPGVPVAVVTADCVPVLLAAPAGRAVAAIHAGWRGLADGVLAASVEALVRASGAAPAELAAGIGPHIGPCCYEVDAPVLDALGAGHGARLPQAARPARPGHAMLDLGLLAEAALAGVGIPTSAIGRAAAACTRCDAVRFHSFRRDGPRSGRLVHFIAASPSQG
jgi:YfiH family protein